MLCVLINIMTCGGSIEGYRVLGRTYTCLDSSCSPHESVCMQGSLGRSCDCGMFVNIEK